VTSLVEQMKEDWNRRAEEDARYYVAFSHRNQDFDGFLASAADVIRKIRQQFVRFRPDGGPGYPTFLEIGCGVGRLIYFLHKDAAAITGVDISAEMIARARQTLSGAQNVTLYALEDNGLACIPDRSIDFIYSYAVFQHLPSKELMYRYFEEARRVVRPGGYFTFQANTAPGLDDEIDTWVGEWAPVEEIAQRLHSSGWRILSIEDADTQNTWITVATKEPDDDAAATDARVTIGDVLGLDPTDGAILSGGPLGYMTAYIQGLPDEMCDIGALRCSVEGRDAPITYIGVGTADTFRQCNILVPPGLATRTYAVSMLWKGQVISEPRTIQVKARAPLSPQVVRVADGVEIGLEGIVSCGLMQVTVNELALPDDLEAWIGGIQLKRRYKVLIEPLSPQWVVSFETDVVPLGRHTVEVGIYGSIIYRSEVTIAAPNYYPETKKPGY
jgi:SAM-dependent methyltransferase